MISWNGTAYLGMAYREFYLTLPVTHHRIEGYDAQPILASVKPDGSYSFLVTVTGTVKFGNKPKPQPFSTTFVLSPSPDQPNVHYISAECFRSV
ncbi:hypothetical protein HMI54_008519 [Coelomomyces lativittatus]|nr:hypothetical protein HMI54_008519 [Coelomomyces lativittatus]